MTEDLQDPEHAGDRDGPPATDPRRDEFAANRMAVLKQIARGDDLVAVLYEISRSIEHYGGRVTASVLQLENGRLRALAAPGLANECIHAVDGRTPANIGEPFRSVIYRDFTDDDNRRITVVGPPSGALGDAMRHAGYAELAVLPILSTSGTPLGVLALFSAAFDVKDGEVLAAFEEMAQITSIAFEQHNLTAQLLQMAHYDALTNLPNRNLLQDRLNQLMHDSERRGITVGVIMLDLDDFKVINDTLGHPAGDHLLQLVAERLQAQVRQSDTVCRFGGDEFVIIAPVRAPWEASLLARRILAALAQPFALDDRWVETRLSIGIGLYPQDSIGADGLIQAADTAMYAAKSAGKNRFRYFDDQMNAQLTNRLAVESELRDALDQLQLVVHYQPVVSLADEHIAGAEALVRWRHPTQGLLKPGTFVPVAEMSELINEVSQYVLRQALVQASAWHRAGHSLVLSVNISARWLHEEGGADSIARMINESGADPQLLQLEIPESALIHDFEAALARLERLKARIGNLRIAIDDFGAAYSSFNYLRRMPVDTLKIDRILVDDIEDADNGPTAQAILKAIVSLGRNLGHRVVAEGIEYPGQAQILREIGCEFGQGVLFSPALEADEFRTAAFG